MCSVHFFSQFVAFFPHSLDIAFPGAEVFYFTESQLINYFSLCFFCVAPKKSLPYTKSLGLTSILSSRNFIVLYFTFRSVVLLILSALSFLTFLLPTNFYLLTCFILRCNIQNHLCLYLFIYHLNHILHIAYLSHKNKGSTKERKIMWFIYCLYLHNRTISSM